MLFSPGIIVTHDNHDRQIQVGDIVRNCQNHEGEVYYDEVRCAFMIRGSVADLAPTPYNEDFEKVEIVTKWHEQ